jgi:outer membrane protein OmpA-like peptidoglycan-associated protein
MKILTLGFLIFVSWASLSTYLYVCKIKDMCTAGNTVVINTLKPDHISITDSTTNIPEAKPTAPEMLLVFFAFDKSEIVSDTNVTKFYNASLAYMHLHSEASLLITGYTDDKGSDKYNQALGYRRAQSVQDYFIRKGVVAEKITLDSKGENEPAENNSTDDGRSKNRRASVSINLN